MSLFYLLEYTKKQYDIVVYFIVDGPAVEFYRNAGIRCVVDKRLGKLPHCTIESQSLNPSKAKFYHDLKAYARHYFKLLPAYMAMQQILVKEMPDIVHLNSTVLVAEALAVKSKKIPLVWHMRDFLEYGNFRIRYSIIRQIIAYCADAVISLCDSELNRVRPVRKGVVIPNFVNFDKFDYHNTKPAHLRQKLGVPDNAKIIGILGWHTPAKGAMTLLKAFAAIADRHSDAILVLFGEGAKEPDVNRFKRILRKLTGKKNLRLDLQEVINEHGLQNRVFFPGVIFDIADYIAEVDVVAAPFTEPHFARPILEAGAMKTLVVTSDLDGTREMVLNGKAGYLAISGNVDDWAEKLQMALSLDNSDKIAEMFENSVKVYNSAINAERTIEIYRELGSLKFG
ncbi:hypothetical protein BJL95_13470 [Methylomonas sp. LWB]|nr:hypothetical protein BJL95_13470 [Methylomonas sp. LWB]